MYAEIQGGLAPTQFEHLTMPARAEWGWTEAFGAVAVDGTRSHGADWEDAVRHVGEAVDELVSADRLDDWHRAADHVADLPPVEMLATGSGWGALERLRRADTGTAWFDDTGTPFPDSSLGAEQEAWLVLAAGPDSSRLGLRESRRPRTSRVATGSGGLPRRRPRG